MSPTVKKIIILIVVVCYAIAPDLFPGPIDDVLVAAGGLLAASKVR